MVDGTRVERFVSRWVETLSSVPSIFGRLAVMSSLRDPNTGHYVHCGLEAALGDAAHDMLLKAHEELFVEWQSLDLKQQMRDLKTYLWEVAQTSARPGEPHKDQTLRIAQIVETWAVTEPFRSFVPVPVLPLARDAFLTNVGTLLILLRAQTKKQAASRARSQP